MSSGSVVTDIRTTSGKYRIITSIPGYKHEDGWFGKITYYDVQTATLGSERPSRGRVDRRYKDFDAFYNALCSKYGPTLIPEFLVGRNKILEDHFTPEFCKARQLLLADWLNNTININSDIQNDQLVIDFLQLKRSNAGDAALAGNTGGSGTKLLSSNDAFMTQMFSVTGQEKVQLSDKDRSHLPTESVMGVYRITDDDL